VLCDNCKENDAVVTLTKIVQGEVRTERLCERCAAAQGVETSVALAKHPLGDFLHAAQQQAVGPHGEGGSCDFCGMSLRDFRSTGRLGCSMCYASFERSLRELLRRVHGSSRHAGRRYEPPASEELQRANTVVELKDRLRRAIETEQFELAASLRDQIRGMGE
jgi:protein arginine kinase activator